MFERPNNISEAYGGGRNIDPNEELEPEAVTAERLKRIRGAVGDYRKKLGIDVEPEVAVEVEGLLAEGEAAQLAGKLERAEALFREVTVKASLMSEQGGEARLRLALCLDSLGKADEARELYTQLGRHPNSDLKKQAQRLLWGMTEATAFLKAESISYDAGMKETYEQYFSSQANAWDVYIKERDAAETDALLRAGWLAAAALLALPVGLLAALRAAADAHRVVISG